MEICLPARSQSALRMQICLALIVLSWWIGLISGAIEPIVLSKEPTAALPYERHIRCRATKSKSALPEGPQCWPSSNCKRRVADGLFTDDEVKGLKAIADKGIGLRPRRGGPTIVDINTGYIRDIDGLDNMFARSKDVFTADDFLLYGDVIRRLKEVVMETFQLEQLYFTAPTFITRIDAETEWKPKGVHDEYWHPHSDRNNTPHYHYSGLLYLSTYEQDFTGGRLLFYPEDTVVDEELHAYPLASSPSVAAEPELVVEPRAGRVAIFSSGPENTHFVEPVTSGLRYVLSFWFTCEPNKQFEIFLDGKAHVQFSHKIRASLKNKGRGSSGDRRTESASRQEDL